MKRRLYRLCRTLMTRDWPKYLNQAVRAINESPNAAIGFLRPIDINSPSDDPIVDGRVGVPEDVPYNIQQENQQKYEQNESNLQKGDYVYLEFSPRPMEKGFDAPVSTAKIQEIYLTFSTPIVLTCRIIKYTKLNASMRGKNRFFLN